jgi:hypothetical protein
VPAEEELRQLREGGVHVIVRPGDPPTYRFDPDREESRIARLVVDDVLKRAAGRSDPVEGARRRRRDPGLALRGLVDPGHRGARHHEQLDVEHRVHDRPDAAAKAAEAAGREPDAEMGVPPRAGAGPSAVSRTEVAVPLVFGAFAFGMPVRGSIVAIALVALLGALAFGSIGLLVGSRVRRSKRFQV